MDYLRAIDTRTSRRTYTGEPIEADKAGYLRDRIEQLNKESGLHCVLVDNAKSAVSSFKASYGMFKDVNSLIVMKGPKCDPDLKEKAGYYGEILVLEATEMELGTCWISGTYDKGNTLLRTIPGEAVVCVIAIGDVPRDQSFKEKFIHNMISRKRKPVEKFYSADQEVPEWFIAGIKAVSKAPSAVNSQKVRFEYENSAVSAKIADNAYPDLIDLGIAKLHFELGAGGEFELGNGAGFTKKD